jgi:hypothetical protein
MVNTHTTGMDSKFYEKYDDVYLNMFGHYFVGFAGISYGRFKAVRCGFDLLKPTGYRMHQKVEHFNNCTLCPHCIYVLYLSENQQRLLPFT